MLKQLLQFRTLLLALLVMAGAGNGWAEETTVTLTQENLGLTGSYTTGTKKVIGGVTYVYTDLMKNSDDIQAKASTGTIYNTTPFGGDITSVSITHSGTARATTILGSTDGTDWIQVATGSGSITGDFSGKGYKYFKITRGSNAAYWTKIEVTYTAVPSFTITAQSNNSTWGTVSLNGSIITATPASGYTYADPAYSVSPANSATVVQSGNQFNVTPSANTTVTINFAAINPYSVAQALANTPASGNYSSTVFVRGIVSSFYKNDIMSDGTNYRYYISDDGKTTDQLLVYNGNGLDNVAFSSTDDLQVGDTVIITGQLTTYNNTKEFAAGNYIVSQKCEKKDATIVVNESETVAYGTTFSVDDTMIEGGEISLSSSNLAVATVDGLVVTPVAVGTTAITVSTAPSMRYNAGSETFTLTVTAPEGMTTAAASTINVFNETFDNSTGTGGNDGSWSGNIATSNLDTDNNGWTFENGNGAKGCAKFGTGKKKGSATTPALRESGTLTLSFRAAAWNGDKTTGGLILSIEEGEGTLGTSTFTLGDSQWGSYETTITGATAATKIKFSAAQKSDNRFFLDDVVVTKQGVALTAKLNASGYATYCSEYPLDFSKADDYSAWQVTGVGDKAITFEKVTGSVKGGTGLLLMGKPSDTVTLTSENSKTVLTNNKLEGTLAPTFVEDNKYYGLSGKQFLKVNRGTVPAGKALLPVVDNVGNVRTLSLVFVDPTTGIAETKTMTNEDAIYNLAGQRISKAQRGVNIVGGKKVLVK